MDFAADTSVKVDPAKDALHVEKCLAQGGFIRLRTPAERAGDDAPSQVRKITPIPIAALTPARLGGARPRIVMVDPKTLLVDEAYQRNLSEKSLRLIRKIIAEWDWRKYSPPVCAETTAGYELIDGQHTATAAASHPSLGHIPIMVVTADSQAERAQAFVSHNTDRLGMTAMQLHFAAVAGGVDKARQVQAVCSAAGVTILRVSPAGGAFKPRETVAVAAIGALIAKRGPERAAEILKIPAAADLGPIHAGLIKAVDHLLHAEEFGGQVAAPALVQALTASAATLPGEAAVFAATHKVPVWKATAAVLFRKTKERRRAAGGVQ